MLFVVMFLLLLLFIPSIDALSISRRQVVDDFFTRTLLVALPTSASSDGDEERLLNIKYSDTWTGTSLPLLDLSQASQVPNWDMARWPDAILRRQASPVDSSYFGTDSLRRATELLRKTCRNAGAVGLAAQQCGVDARIVYLEPQMAMVNPRIIRRSDERDMRVWREQCLVLPPTFSATVLRDAWIDVEYNDWKGTLYKKRLRGELARAAQHELDHDRGILVLDHVDMNEMENAKMRAIEQNGHELRMALAYSRTIDEQRNALA
jgi:peptide deformylase